MIQITPMTPDVHRTDLGTFTKPRPSIEGAIFGVGTAAALFTVVISTGLQIMGAL